MTNEVVDGEWESLAYSLCLEECDDPHHLIWEHDGPWGEAWQKYEGDAKRMISLVRLHRPEIDLTARREILDRIDAHDGKWVHSNGKTYTVMCITNRHADPMNQDEYPMMVVYKDTDKKIWSKTPEEFIRSRKELPHSCCVCGSTENLYKDGWHGYRCSSPDCVCF